jgi:purine-nucleoside phosphorylase
MLEKIKETAGYIKSKVDFEPEAGIILGTGLGNLVSEIDVRFSLDYKDIPNFPVSTVEGHKGRLIFGFLNGKKVVAMQGRFHFYEGYSMKQVTFPIRVLKFLNIKYLFISNAAGGLNPEYRVGDLVLINDHINLFPENPLHGPNLEELGPRFPDMSRVYDYDLINKAAVVARRNNILVHKGVYVGVQGPTFETPAEYKYLRVIGGDAVGMSSVPEAIVAHHMGIVVMAMSVVTDSGVPGEIVEITHKDVQDVAEKAEPKMTLILKELLKQL